MKLGYNEQIFQSQMIIYYTGRPGCNEPRLYELAGSELFVMSKFDVIHS